MKLLILSIFLLMFLHISCESEKLESENLEEDSIKLPNNNIPEEPERNVLGIDIMAVIRAN